MKIALISVVLPLLGGCIIYDTKAGRACFGCADDEVAGLEARDTAEADAVEEDDGVVFGLSPSVAEPGASLIGSLDVLEGDYDLGAVTSVEVYGPATLLVSEPRDGELLLGLAVASTASVGATVDLLLHGADGGVALVDDALTVVAPGTADDGQAGGGNADGDEGSGGADDGGTTGSGDGSGAGADDCP